MQFRFPPMESNYRIKRSVVKPVRDKPAKFAIFTHGAFWRRCYRGLQLRANQEFEPRVPQYFLICISRISENEFIPLQGVEEFLNAYL